MNKRCLFLVAFLVMLLGGNLYLEWRVGLWSEEEKQREFDYTSRPFQLSATPSMLNTKKFYLLKYRGILGLYDKFDVTWECLFIYDWQYMKELRIEAIAIIQEEHFEKIMCEMSLESVASFQCSYYAQQFFKESGYEFDSHYRGYNEDSAFYFIALKKLPDRSYLVCCYYYDDYVALSIP